MTAEPEREFVHRCQRSGKNPTEDEWRWRAGYWTTCADCLQRVPLVTANARAVRRTAHYLAEHVASSGGGAS